MEPKIVFEDEFFLVVDKPSGMVVNRADTTAKILTVQDWVEHYLKWEVGNRQSFSANGKLDTEMGSGKSKDQNISLQNPASHIPRLTSDFYLRAGIVHRLDKETSGLLIIAKTLEAFTNLQAQFKNREVRKKYLALVHGKVIPEVGEINAPVGRLPWNRERFGVLPGGKEAVTKYRVIPSERSESRNLGQRPRALLDSSARPPLAALVGMTTLLELSPQTGRTHQIRIHLQYLGFPIVGDTFYAGRKQAIEDRKFCPRVFLHAAGISFLHPKTGEKLEFNSPLPPDLEKILSFFVIARSE